MRSNFVASIPEVIGSPKLLFKKSSDATATTTCHIPQKFVGCDVSLVGTEMN